MSVLLLESASIDENASMMRLSGGVLQGLQLVDQLHEPTADHAADENARMNCVFTSLAAISRKVGGHPEANGDAIKDGCIRYGQDYTGGADAEVVESDGCLDRKWGIHADTVHFQPNRSSMVVFLRTVADAGHFAVVTIPSQWNGQVTQPGYNPDSPNFWTHACVYCGYFGDTHVLMNPWGGFLMYYSSADLAERLCFLKVYPVHPVSGGTPAPTPSPAPQGKSMLVLERDATGTITGAHDSDHPDLHLLQGFAQAASDNHLLNGSIAVPETRLVSGESIAVVRGGARAAMTYSTQVGVKLYGDDVVLAFQDLYDAWQQEKNKPAPPTPAPVDNSQAVADLNAAVQAALHAIGEVK